MNKFNNLKEEGFKPASFIQNVDLYLGFWKFFLFWLVVFLGLALIYLRYAEKIYYSEATILLQDEKQASGDMAGLSELATLAGRTSSSAAYVNDQTQVLQSRRIMRKVVESNELNIRYFILGRVGEKEVIKSYSPLQVLLLEPNNPRLDSMVYELNIEKTKQGIAVWDKFRKKQMYQPGNKLSTVVGQIVLLGSGDLKDWEGEMRIQFIPKDFSVDIIRSLVEVTSNSKEQSFAIRLSTRTSSPQKGELIINSLIDHYDRDRAYDQESLSRNTAKFINSRLGLISRDLKSVDSKVAIYKDNNNLPDIQLQTRQSLMDASEQEKSLMEFQTQLYLADIVRTNSMDDDSTLLPSNIGLSDESIQRIIQSYNELILERMDLLQSSTVQNPVFVRLEQNRLSMKESLNVSLDNYKRSLQIKIANIEGQMNKAKVELTQYPEQELKFRDISREQKVIESIYLFLLQKREENDINASSTPANLKIVDHAYGYTAPISPKKTYVLGGGVLLGLLIPFGLLYLKFLFDNKVHSKKDLEDLIGAPLLGQVPKVKEVILEDNSRAPLAESLRIIRTNLSFMLGGLNSGGKVLYVTSTISGEGKSFIATNLSKIIAQSGKKVLLIGADIRSPKVLEYLGISQYKHSQIGITQYLINPFISVKDLVISKPVPYQFDVIYSGYIAPNPAELLMNGNFKGIIEYGRKHYDYVIVDTAPVSLVTDTILVHDLADLTIYVSRANFLDKRMTEIPRELYQEGKLKNMALVLNDVDFKSGYGYGYGYGYGEQGAKKIPFAKLVFKELKKAIYFK